MEGWEVDQTVGFTSVGGWRVDLTVGFTSVWDREVPGGGRGQGAQRDRSNKTNYL